jgi:hypothetical protein
MAKKPVVEILPTRDQIGEYNEGAMFAEGFDDCLLGVVERFGAEALALYDLERVIQKLMSRDGMARDVAEEFFAVNIIGAWVGENTPAFATILRK